MLYPYFTHAVPASKALSLSFLSLKEFLLTQKCKRGLVRAGKGIFPGYYLGPFRGLRGEVVRSGRMGSVPQESARKILSLSFKAITYCARIRLPRVRISLISRDARLNTAIQMDVMPAGRRWRNELSEYRRLKDARSVALKLMNP